ncbi:MAG: alpha/beta hydrolase [Chloroflexi bacterium]|nr:alpha/beta hydrolase [Chloroflexota bacterium]
MPGGFLEQLAAPPTNYHVFAIRLRPLSKADERQGEDLTPRWYPRWADDVFAATQVLGLSDFIYTGVSHGGVIGWHLAVERPGLLKGLVAIVGVPPLRASRTTARSGRASQMAARNDVVSLRANMARLFGPSTDPARLERRESIIQSRIERVLATPPEEVAVNLGIGFPDIETDAELDDVLRQIHAPTLVIGGMHDPWVTPEDLLRTARAVTGSKLVIFEDESHLLALESPVKVIDEFKIFVANLVGQRCATASET